METFDVLFEPAKVGPIELKNRFVATATGLGVYTHDFEKYARNVTSFVETLAKGGVGLIILASFGAASVDAFPPDQREYGWYDRSLPLMRELVRVAHRHAARLAIQVHHVGRQGSSPKRFAPSPIPWSPREPIPQELSEEEIANLVQRFGYCAGLACNAGFDLIEIHAGHGYLANEFLSPRSNQRTDHYGGDVEHRLRFPIEVIRSVRQAIGANVPLSLRISGSERVEGGLSLDDMQLLAPRLAAAGIDLLNVSGGAYGSNPVIVAPYSVPYGLNLPYARTIKPLVNVPVVSTGRLWDPHLMARIVATCQADLVGLGRALWADPELPNKVREGRVEDIRYCVACNQGCIDRGGEVVRSCLVNPAWAREWELGPIPAVTAKTVVVVGGGGAGMEAARIAALRGHKVTLFERSPLLGGRWLLAALPPGKEEFVSFLRWEERQLRQLKVNIVLATNASAELIEAIGPDAVIIATGARPTIPETVGDHALHAEEALLAPWRVGPRVLVVGGDRLGLETASVLAAAGRSVLVAAGAHLGTDMGATTRFHLLNQLKALAVEVRRVPDGVRLEGSTALLPGVRESFDTVVWARDYVPANELATELAGKIKELHVIGDAASVRNGMAAVADGLAAGLAV